VSTDDIMAAAGIARRTVAVWVEMGFLPPPLKVSLGIGGVFNRFPAYAAERARFVAAKRAAGFTYDEVRVMLAEMDAQEAARPRRSPRARRPSPAGAKGRTPPVACPPRAPRTMRPP
jgi:DNA-binding transcriptional MerR regulator